jgi:hypothetical protein
MEFPEPKEFRLGYANKGADGSGSGPGLARLVVAAMGEAIKRGLEDMRHFEELGVLIEGINKDRIGDITCNLLKPQLIEYTQNICHSYDIPLHNKSLKHSAFNKMRQRWEDGEHLVPADPASGDPILLIPWRFLAELPKINAFDFEDTALRDDLNLNISSNVRKPDIIRLARRNPEVLRRWVTAQEASTPTPYDVKKDPKLIVKWQKIAGSAVQAEPLRSANAISTEEDLMRFVHEEPNMQLLFLAVLDGYCEMAGLRLDREVETGRGPVDFTFTGDKHTRVLVEMKKLTHGEFWHGLRVQTRIRD